MLTYWVSMGGDAAAIATAAVAVWAYGKYRWDRRQRRRQLEGYLREESECLGPDKHSIIHLMARLKMTEAQIFEAAFSSRSVRAGIRVGDDGMAERILFENQATSEPEPGQSTPRF